MKTIEHSISENKEELLRKGYFLASYDGALCLDEKNRNSINVYEDGLSLSGAILFAKQVWENMENVKDVKTCMNKTKSYDVYVLTEAQK